VLIATPGDTGDEVEAIIASIHSWNGRRAEAEGVILLPRHWKSDAVPLVDANGAQSVIDSQLVDSADIVIAVFDSRLGQVTEDAVSGTAHEIERTTEAGKPVHVYFSDEPISRNADPKELARLNKFRKEMEAKSLLGVYADPTDLGYQVREAIEHDLTQMDLGVVKLPVAAPPEHAMPRLRYADYGDSKRLVVENKSLNVSAEKLMLEVVEGNYLRLLYDRQPIDLLPLADYSWPIALAMGSKRIIIKMTWFEGEEAQEQTQTVSF
jgi:nucleoside 2-deoxyribosyltransferase